MNSTNKQYPTLYTDLSKKKLDLEKQILFHIICMKDYEKFISFYNSYEKLLTKDGKSICERIITRYGRISDKSRKEILLPPIEEVFKIYNEENTDPNLFFPKAVYEDYEVTVKEYAELLKVDQVNQLLVSNANAIKTTNTDVVIDSLNSGLKNISKLNQEISVVDIDHCFESVLERSIAIESGLKGILTPWETLNSVNLGFWGGQIYVFVAKSGIGKTFLLLLLGQYMRNKNKRVLVITPEMTVLQIATRYASFELSIPLSSITKGKLTAQQKDKFHSYIHSMNEIGSFGVINSQDFSFSIGQIRKSVASYKPDIILVDGLYLIKTTKKQATSHEDGEELMKELKNISLEYNIPVIGTTQFNREFKNDMDKETITNCIAKASAVEHYATSIYAVTRTEDERVDNKMKIIHLKERDGAVLNNPIILNWDFVRGNFNELSQEEIEASMPDSNEVIKDQSEKKSKQNTFAYGKIQSKQQTAKDFIQLESAEDNGTEPPF